MTINRDTYMEPEEYQEATDAELIGQLEADLAAARERIAELETLIGAAEQVIKLTKQKADLWRDRPDSHWLARLMQEVGELASSLVGDHDDPPSQELMQIASIALNWLNYMQAAALAKDEQ